MKKTRRSSRGGCGEGLAAPAPEFIGGEPDIGRDDSGDDQRTQICVLRHDWQPAHQQPEHRAGDEIDRFNRPAVEHARAGPGHRKGGKQQGVGEIDAYKVGRRSVQSEQGNRAKPGDMGKAPPADRPQSHVLRPDEEQQQPKDSLDINRD